MKNQKGQALILIAFGIVVLLGMTALAIDGGNAFADRRHAQNAADTAALSAALAKIDNRNWMNAAYERASDNGYDDDGVTNTVTVVSPPVDGPYACPAKNCQDYIQVIIVSNVDTWFARIVGIDQITNRVEAVAKAKPWRPYYDGHAVVSLSPGDGKDNTPEFVYSGTADVIVEGSGLFVNSGDNCPVKNNGGATIEVPYVTTVGPCNNTQSGTQYPYPPSYPEFDDLCDRPNAVTINNTNKSFPVGTGHTVESNKIYCINGDFEINNGTYNATNVTFVVGGLVKITGGNVNFAAAPGLPLFYLPYDDDKFKNTGEPDDKYSVTIVGNTGVVLTGLFLAPASNCDISGGSETNPLRGQTVCYTISLGGGSGTVVQYNDNDNVDEPPQVELTQ